MAGPAAARMCAGMRALALLLSAVPLNVEHELTQQRKWDKQETQEYMRHFNALKLDKLTSDPRQPLMLFDEREGGKKNL